jgi:cytochrome c-type biogenesis protein CcmE
MVKTMRLFAALTFLAITACGGGAKQVTPSALVSDAATYDGQRVDVSGTVKNPQIRKTRRGQATMYDLCDTNCIHVFQFGTTPVTDGSTVTVTGMFRMSFGRMQHFSNVLLVGGRGGFNRGQGGGQQGSASPQ